MSSATLPSLADALVLGLTEHEYELICQKQGRVPNRVELAMYSLLWSEHCAYKHSKKLLRTLPTEGEHVVMGPGENAGAVDVGGGLVCAFKVESHNHPSAVEPFQGAATGVGGILRDIFAIGARPIAVLDSLRFGEPEFGLPYPFDNVEEDKGRFGREISQETTQQRRTPENGENLAGNRSNLAGNRSDLAGSRPAPAGERLGPAGGRLGPAPAGGGLGPAPAGERQAPAGERQGPAGGRLGPAAHRSRYLLDRAVAGIAHYGNSIGVPTVGGEVYFEAPYEQNCLVNAMALGIGERDRLVRSAAAGIGNIVVLFGASTGRDGIGGASVLASAELGDEGTDGDKRPTVQVGDPFEEKKLMECSLELLERSLIVSLQDLGAAGLTSSASEMASKGKVGIDIDVAKVPLREPGMEPFEIMVSESQERMLCVVEPANVGEVLALCEKWEVGGAAIGTVTGTGRMCIFRGEELLGDIPVRALVDDCPLYDLEPAKPTKPLYEAPATAPPFPAKDAAETLRALLASPNIASRRPLFEHYDAVVQSRTVRRPEQADAAVLAIRPLGAGAPAGKPVAEGAVTPPTGLPAAEGAVTPPTGLPGAVGAVTPSTGLPRAEGAVPARGQIAGIAVSIDCNGRRVAADPYTGTVAAVLECASNLACVGAEPLGTTNNLNFGNPEKPPIAWQLTEAVRGLGDACRAVAAPIVGGNVSLYNEGAAGPIYPTPVIGMVGRLPDVRRAGRLGFAGVPDGGPRLEGHERAGDAIAIVGPFAPSLEASELAKLRGEALPDGLPAIDVAAVVAAQAAVRDAMREGMLTSAHDIAEGGVAVALAECCLAGGIGARVRLSDGDGGAGKARSGDAAEGKARAGDAGGDEVSERLFGECSGAFVVSGEEGSLRALGERTSVELIGKVGGDALVVDDRIELSLSELGVAHGALAELFA